MPPKKGMELIPGVGRLSYISMKLEGDDSFLELDRSELGPAGTPSDRDVLLNVTARVSGYSASDQAWVIGSDLDEFITRLHNLESCRQGHAALTGASPGDLLLDFYSTDPLGHMAVRGHLGWNNSKGFLLQLRFGFAFEPDYLPTLVRYFEAIRK